jgi:hypothetical protein
LDWIARYISRTCSTKILCHERMATIDLLLGQPRVAFIVEN